MKAARGVGGGGGKRKADAVEKKVKSEPAAKKGKGKKKVKVEEDEDEEEEEEMGGGGGGGSVLEDLAELISMGKLAKMTVPQLKELCKERGLPVSGKKGDLIDRLKMDVEEDDR